MKAKVDCDEKNEYNAGLCYNNCGENFDGVGPVCWERCPADKPVDCGALCGESVSDCLNNVAQMVFSLGELAAKITGMVTTLGVSTLTTDAAKAAVQSAADSMKEAATKVSKDVMKKVSSELGGVKSFATSELRKFVSNTQTSVVDKLRLITTDPNISSNAKMEAAQSLTKLFGDISSNVKNKLVTFESDSRKNLGGKAKIINELIKQFPGVSPEIAEQLASMVSNPQEVDYKEFITKIDPIGISSVVQAFN